MILQDDRNTRRERGQRQHIAGKSETVHVKHVRLEVGEQPPSRSGVAWPLGLVKRQEMIVHPAALQSLRMRARLHHGHANSARACGFGDVHETGPRIEKLRRQPLFRVLKKLICTACNGARMTSTGS